jgi:hypothetical protein
LILTLGNPGIKLTSKPPITSRIGYAMRSLVAHMFSSTMAAIIARRNGKNECINDYLRFESNNYYSLVDVVGFYFTGYKI